MPSKLPLTELHLFTLIDELLLTSYRMLKMAIPRIVWQTWKTHQVPDKWKESPESIRRYCPGWKYRLTDDQENLDFVRKEFPQYLSLYQSFDREIYRVDMVRYLRLYRYGGVYMDLDIKLKRPLDELFKGDGDLYLVRTPNLNGYTNSFMASKPKCPFWLRCIEEIKRRSQNRPWYIIGDLKVIWTTGPDMITEVARQYNQPFVTIPYLLGHPCTICDHYLNRPCSEDDSYVEELQGSSWTGTASSLFHFVVCRWDLVVPLVIMVILLLLFLLTRPWTWGTNSNEVQVLDPKRLDSKVRVQVAPGSYQKILN